MRAWKRIVALALAALSCAVCAAEGMTLEEKIAAGEEEVLQWYEAGGAVAETDALAALECMIDRGGAMFANAGELTEDDAVALARATTYVEQACARAAVSVTSPAVRLCSAVRTGVEQLYKQGLPWGESGVENYAVAFASAAEEIGADMNGVVSELCGGASLRTVLETAEAEVAQWLAQGGEIVKDEVERAVAYLREHAEDLEKDVAEIGEEAAARLAQALAYVEAALDRGLDGADAALRDMAAQVRAGVDRLWKEGQSWVEAGMDEVREAFSQARAEVEAGWDELRTAIAEAFS